MTLLFDTNIVLDFLRNGPITSSIDNKYDLNSENTIIAISAVTIGELNALAIKRNWGEKRKSKLKEDLKKFLVIPVNSRDILSLYGEIDAFSQGKFQRSLPKGMSARNMGKNDLWIAAAASATQSTLLSTDRDFAHLEGVFIKYACYDPKLYY